MKHYNFLSEFADKYDNYIIDLWGVLHDGFAAYPNAIDALTRLKASGKNIILLSNAPRRAEKARETLDRLGFADNLYDHILTSGEIAYRYLRDNCPHGKKYFYIGATKDTDVLDGLDYVAVDDAAEADFTLVTGFENFGDDFDTKRPQADAALAANLPMICINPDRVVVRQTGEVMLCAGLIGEYYKKHGGNVHMFGKPYQDVYDACFAAFGDIDKSRTIGIGDSIHTDVAGANSASITSALNVCGILSGDLGVKFGELPTDSKLEEICEREGNKPDIILPQLIW